MVQVLQRRGSREGGCARRAEEVRGHGEVLGEVRQARPLLATMRLLGIQIPGGGVPPPGSIFLNLVTDRTLIQRIPTTTYFQIVKTRSKFRRSISPLR